MMTMTFFDALTTRRVSAFQHDDRPHPVQRLANRLRARRDYKRLEDMPDRLLADVGLTRAQIRHELSRTLF